MVALDRDPEMIGAAKRRFCEKGIPEERVRWVVGSFGDLARHLAGLGIRRFDGILFDFGLNSEQLADPSRGFSFNAEGPLDVRFSRQEAIPTLAEWLAKTTVEELERVLRENGDERWAKRIARAIIWRREREPIQTTTQLATAIRSAVPPTKGRRRIDAATRSFQALRIRVNAETEHIKRGLEQAIAGLAPGGRMVVLSFHSGEDRLVKEAFRRHHLRGERPEAGGQRETENQPVLEILTRKPVRPSEAECENNPRARSARLRAAVRES